MTTDLRDGAPWTGDDFRRLKLELSEHHDVERVARRLGRGVTVEQVREIAEDLGGCQAARWHRGKSPSLPNSICATPTV